MAMVGKPFAVEVLASKINEMVNLPMGSCKHTCSRRTIREHGPLLQALVAVLPAGRSNASPLTCRYFSGLCRLRCW